MRSLATTAASRPARCLYSERRAQRCGLPGCTRCACSINCVEAAESPQSVCVGSVFQIRDPSLPDQWRSIILFGRNVASYKFALAAALLEVKPTSSDLVRLEDLAEPFALNICRHLKDADKQATSPGSRFLAACRAYNRGETSLSDLRAATVRLGFQNVIEAFHVVGAADVPTRFFLDERRTSGAIRVTDDFQRLLEQGQASNLPHETESRWRLVETAWQMNLPAHLLRVAYDGATEQLVTVSRFRRKAITRVRPALNGYQRGRCFYCYCELAIVGGAGVVIDVDHFIPHFLGPYLSGAASAIIDGVWNLVLSCNECNRGVGGKFGRLPSVTLLERLYARNESLIASHHPLRETLMLQTGTTADARRAFLQAVYEQARTVLPGTPWRQLRVVGEPF